jgi:uncharacterized protein YjbI with pentapeptide repeats
MPSSLGSICAAPICGAPISIGPISPRRNWERCAKSGATISTFSRSSSTRGPPGARLVSADLRGAHLRGADFSDADLSDADLQQAMLDAANFTGANLRGADFSRCQHQGSTKKESRTAPL